jgi:hypothetical protein
MSKSIIDHCINILKREDVKKEIKNMFQPIIDIILQEIYPYIYLSLLFVIISFLLILAIFIIVLQSKTRYFSPLKGV